MPKAKSSKKAPIQAYTKNLQPAVKPEKKATIVDLVADYQRSVRGMK